MPKADIICCFYRQHAYAPFFWWGIAENREAINNVIIVNDEPWDDRAPERMQSLIPDGITAVWLEHQHPGKGTHGVAHSFNQGCRYASTDYVFFTSADQILQPGAVADALEFAAPQRMVLGRVDAIAMDTQLSELSSSEPPVIRHDIYSQEIPKLRAHRGDIITNAWRNGHTLVHLPSHFAIDGFDERFVDWGYGLEDQDYCARWLLEYGPHSIWWGDGASWHFAGDRPSAETSKIEWHQEAVDLLNSRLQAMYTKFGTPPDQRKVYSRRVE